MSVVLDTQATFTHAPTTHALGHSIARSYFRANAAPAPKSTSQLVHSDLSLTAYTSVSYYNGHMIGSAYRPSTVGRRDGILGNDVNKDASVISIVAVIFPHPV